MNRDSGTDSANGGWLRRLVRHPVNKLKIMKTDRTKKTTRRKFLMTAWNYPGMSTLMIAGTKRATRKEAGQYMLGPDTNSRLLTGREEYMSNAEISQLCEWEA